MFFSQTRSSRDNMWHEARKQERKIRGMLVDLKKRAERRKEFYERIKQDPAQFLQLHGRRCKIHIDLAIAQAADSPVTMMPWQGNRDIMIDRFDVRAHLDMIPEYKPAAEPPPMTDEQKEEERQTNYERYRTLVQNDFLGVTEDKFLHQIYLEERYGPIGKPVGTTEDEKKKLAEKKAAISYVYEDSTPAPSTSSNQNEEQQEEEEDKEDLSDIDLDVTVDVNELTIEQSKEMNDYSHAYGMESTDFISYLHLDKEEQERLKQARELEEEKAMYSGRKSRRERRALREKKLKNRKVTSPPSYAARASPTYKAFRAQSSSRSRSRSPQNAGEITFITSFGDDASEDEDHASKKALSKATPSTSGPASGGGSSSGGKASSSRTSGSRQDGNSRRKSRDRSRDRRAGSSHGSGRGGRQLRRRSSTSRSRSSSAGRGRRRSRSRSRSRNRSSYRAQRGPRRRSRSLRLRSPRHRGGRRSASRSRSRSRSRHRGGYRRRSSSSPRSPPRGARDRRSKSRSRSRSRSSPPRKLPSPPRKSYYRHSLSKSRSKSLSSDDDTGNGGGDESKMTATTTRSRSDSSSDESRGQSSTGTANGNRRNWPSADALRPNVSVGKPGPASKGPAGAAGGVLSVREKLKRKMQAALNKQYKADKRAEREKQDKLNQERWDRAEELRGMALRLRQREREKRHKERDEYGYDPDESRDGHDGYSSRSGSRSRSRSRSPEPRPPGESPYSGPPPDYPRNSSYSSRRRSRSRSRSPPQDYYRSRPPPSSSWSSSRGLVDY
ncbi:uncharacterized protein LOC144148850 [Haemaphysalis longicornis]